MAKSKRKKNLEAKHAAEGKKIFQIVVITTIVLIVLLFLLYNFN